MRGAHHIDTAAVDDAFRVLETGAVKGHHTFYAFTNRNRNRKEKDENETLPTCDTVTDEFTSLLMIQYAS